MSAALACACPTPVVVRVYPHEMVGLRRLAARRGEGKLARFSRKKSELWSDATVDVVGLTGEYVVARATGGRVDWSGYGCRGDAGVDMVIRGVRCGIKTNHRRGGYLLVEFAKDLEGIDALVLVQGVCRGNLATCACREGTSEPTDWTVAGWIPVGEFKRRCKTADWGMGRRWYMRAEDLRDLAALAPKALSA